MCVCVKRVKRVTSQVFHQQDSHNELFGSTVDTTTHAHTDSVNNFVRNEEALFLFTDTLVLQSEARWISSGVGYYFR